MAFWETKTLDEMTTDEWESLCDGCGKCCLIKLEDDQTGAIFFTRVVCDLIDLKTCRCTRYTDRCRLVPACIDLKQHDFKDYPWLPATCAYRVLADGGKLARWHPLVSGKRSTVQQAGVSISSFAMKQADLGKVDLTDYIIHWLD